MAASDIGLSVLPEEMEIEVLLHVPVKSVLRFHAVCRRWAELLDSEEFCVAWMKLAESASATEPVAQVLFLPLTPRKFLISTEVCCGDGRPLLTIDGLCGQSTVMAPAPCHGLTLLHGPVSGPYHVLNAATRAIAKLPPHSQDGPLGLPSSAGIGFDARTKVFKVVRLFTTGERPEDWFARVKCEVHTLGRGPDHGWRPPTSSAADSDGVVEPPTLAGAALRATLYVHEQAPVFADGFIHWLINPIFCKPVAEARRPAAVVLSFSLSEETFNSWIQQPPFHSYARESHLMEMDGRLCMLRDLRRGGSGSSLEIWRYGPTADGGDDVWLLKLHLDLAQHARRDLLIEPQFVRVVGASVGKIKVIFIATSKGNVVAYDPMRGTLETILQLRGGTAIGERETMHFLPRVSLFKESLAAVH